MIRLVLKINVLHIIFLIYPIRVVCIHHPGSKLPDFSTLTLNMSLGSRTWYWMGSNIVKIDQDEKNIKQ